jgi:uncharacterized protein YndB with AHSA1/START domain
MEEAMMAESEIEPVTLQRLGDRVAARMTRTYGEPVSAVWSALTDPVVRVGWLAPGEIELKVGGRARLDFVDSGIVIDSAVSALESGRLLEFSWSGPGETPRPVRFELAADGEATALTLTLTLPAEEDVGRSCAGWSAHLEMLAATLAGVTIKFPFERFKAAREAYRAQYAAA